MPITQATKDLIEAIERGDIRDGQLAISKGASVNAVDHGKRDGVTVLIYAISLGRLNLAQHMIDKGADVNAYNKHGNTPLMYAAKLDTVS